MAGAIVNKTFFTSGGTTALAVTIPSTTSGNVLLVWVEITQNNTDTCAVTGTGLSFTNKIAFAGLGKLTAALADNIAGGVTSLTVTPSGFASLQGVALEISGLVNPSFDAAGTGHANTFGQANPQVTGAITTVATNTFGVAFFSDVRSKAGTFSAFTSGWTGGTTADSSDYATQNFTSVQTSITVSANYSNTSAQNVDAVIISLAVSGGAAAVPGLFIPTAGPSYAI